MVEPLFFTIILGSKDLNFPRVARIDSHFGPFREIIKPICFLFRMKSLVPMKERSLSLISPLGWMTADAP